MWSSRLFWQFLLALNLPNFVLAATILFLAFRGSAGSPSTLSSSLFWGMLLGWGAISLPASVWIARRVMRMLNQLNVSAQAMERGDFSRNVHAHSRDGLGAAASAFNTMREELAHRIGRLEENHHRMTTVLSGMVEGVLAVDPQQRVLLANEACRGLLGISTRDVVGRPLLEVVRNLEVQQTVLAALQGSESSARELPVTSTSRRVMRVLATRLPGEPCPGVVVVLHDVTDLRRLENLRRDFVANVSHELKTPLASIKAYAETLRLGAINDQEHNLVFVSRIEEQATRLHQLILDLLHLARVETGTEAFEFSAVSLREICCECVGQHSAAAAAAGVTVQVADLLEDVLVWADSDGIRMIGDNLVSNAIKFTPPGGTVTMRWKREPELAVLEVVDTGIGIAPQDQSRVFERFYRVDKARSRELGGTGLGLAIVKHLAQAFGGDVGLTSEPGRGSTFLVRLPLAPEG